MHNLTLTEGVKQINVYNENDILWFPSIVQNLKVWPKWQLTRNRYYWGIGYIKVKITIYLLTQCWLVNVLYLLHSDLIFSVQLLSPEILRPARKHETASLTTTLNMHLRYSCPFSSWFCMTHRTLLKFLKVETTWNTFCLFRPAEISTDRPKYLSSRQRKEKRLTFSMITQPDLSRLHANKIPRQRAAKKRLTPFLWQRSQMRASLFFSRFKVTHLKGSIRASNSGGMENKNL